MSFLTPGSSFPSAQPVDCSRRSLLTRLSYPSALLAGALLFGASLLHAQNTPKYMIDEDCAAFDVGGNNAIVYAVPRLKRIKRIILERDDIWISAGPGKERRIVDADKFMPIPPVTGYSVSSLVWSPDQHRIAANMTLLKPPPGWDFDPYKKKSKKKSDDDDEIDREDEKPLPSVGGGKVVAIFDGDGKEISVAGSKSRFIEDATDGAWLADNATLVYLTPGGKQIHRVSADGTNKTLFDGHPFSAVAWDTARNRAFAVGEDLSLRGGLSLVQLDLLKETVTVISRIESYSGSLTVSPTGSKVAFFEDGDTIEVVDLAHPANPLRAQAGLGIFEWGQDEDRVLLKRGPADRSGDLVWVGLRDDSFRPALHDLEYHEFQIAPDGSIIAVTEPGKRVLKIYSLQ